MAFIFKFLFTFLLGFLLILPQITAQETSQRLTHVLSSKGYVAMALVLEQTLKTLVAAADAIHNNSTITIFCPPDTAFFSLKYSQPPLTLLQYHAVPIKLEREGLESSFPYESKIDTLLAGHPLVLTTIPGSRRASINNVKITEWNIYNDSRVIIYGSEDFFDPAFQVLIYPWYDGRGSKSNHIKNNTGSIINSSRQEVDYSLGWLAVIVIVIVIMIVIFIFVYSSVNIRQHNHVLAIYCGYNTIDDESDSSITIEV